VLEHLPDLRKFGKLRASAAQGYREEALRRAKESDILFVASEEAATACHILNWLEANCELACSPRFYRVQCASADHKLSRLRSSRRSQSVMLNLVRCPNVAFTNSRSRNCSLFSGFADPLGVLHGAPFPPSRKYE
jgi:hypothetical protein